MCTRKGKWVGFGRSASSDSEGCGCTPRSGCILMRLSMSVVIRRCMEYLCSNVISDMCISDVPYLGLLLCDTVVHPAPPSPHPPPNMSFHIYVPRQYCAWLAALGHMNYAVVLFVWGG